MATIDDMCSVMQHAKNGKPIQRRCLVNGVPSYWYDCPEPRWNWDQYEYRVKVSPRKFFMVEWPTRVFVYDTIADALESSRREVCGSCGTIIPVQEIQDGEA